MLEDRVFSKTDSSKISDKFTAVLLLGGNDLDDAGKAFMQRYDVGGFPTLLAMTPDGAVIGRDFDRSLQGILDTMEKAATTNDEFVKTEADLGKKTDDESVRTLADLYMKRSQLTEARSRYEKLTKDAPQVKDQEALLQILTSQAATDERKALLKVLVDTRSDNEKHIEWRIEHATADLPTRVTSREEWLDVMGKRKEILTALLPEVKKPADQAAVRGMLAGILSNTRDREGANEHIDWILANAPKSKAASNALWMKSNGLIRQGQMEGDPDKAKEAKVLWEQLVKDHPDTRFGKQAAQVMPQLDGLIKMLETKKTEAEAAKAEAEAAKAAEEKAKAEEEKKAAEEKKEEPAPATPDK